MTLQYEQISMVKSECIYVIMFNCNCVQSFIKCDTKSGGSINVSAEIQVNSTDTFLYFRVDDTGVGIPPSESRNIFKPLSQLDMTATKQEKGLGNALAATMELIESMHGKIDFTRKKAKVLHLGLSVPLDKWCELESVKIHYICLDSGRYTLNLSIASWFE